MPSAATVRTQVEAALGDRIPSALRLAPHEIRPTASTGIHTVDKILDGGLPIGAITEIVGAECSGRTSFTLSFLARMTQAGKVCAWIDVSNSLQPDSAAAAGVELSQMLWVRCGTGGMSQLHDAGPQQPFVLPEQYFVPPQVKRGLHGGGCGGHPRAELRGLSEAVSGLLRPEVTAPGRAEPVRRTQAEKADVESCPIAVLSTLKKQNGPVKPWSRIEQGLRVADLLLQGGGFSAIVLDMAGVAPEFSSRVPLATWFRYRAAAEKSQTSVVLLTQHACAKSSAGLVLQLRPGSVNPQQTVFTGIEHQIEVARQRFSIHESSNVIPLRKPPQRTTSAVWQARTAWAGRG